MKFPTEYLERVLEEFLLEIPSYNSEGVSVGVRGEIPMGIFGWHSGGIFEKIHKEISEEISKWISWGISA